MGKMYFHNNKMIKTECMEFIVDVFAQLTDNCASLGSGFNSSRHLRPNNGPELTIRLKVIFWHA